MGWKPGESGNPLGKNGFSKPNTFQVMCKRDTYKIYNLIMEIAENPLQHPGARMAGLKLLVEMGHGRAPQSIRIETGDDLSPAMMSQEQLNLAASGMMKELVFDLIRTGKLQEYTKEYNLDHNEGVVLKDEKGLVTPLLEEGNNAGENKDTL